jgi:nucleoside phosphorylase
MLPVVVILTAIQEEYEAVREHLDQPAEVFVDGTMYEKGNFGGEQPIAQIIIRQCGQSNVVAAGETVRAINAFQPDYMFFVGIAGGRKDVKIGDVVFGSKIYYYEVQKLTTQGAKYRPDQATSTYEIEEVVKLAQTNGEWKRLIKERNKQFIVRIGAIASGEKLIDNYSDRVAQDIDVHFNDTLAVEMEGFGFGRMLTKQGGKARQIYFGVFRGISDLVNAPTQELPGESKRPTFAKQVASRTAAGLAFWTLYKHIDLKKKSILNQILRPQPNF